jgi:hypothetical protein
MNTRCTCEKDILALRMLKDNWRTGASRLQHDVDLRGPLYSHSDIVCWLIQSNRIATISKYFNMGCMTFRSPCTTPLTSQKTVSMNGTDVCTIIPTNNLHSSININYWNIFLSAVENSSTARCLFCNDISLHCAIFTAVIQRPLVEVLWNFTQKCREVQLNECR